MAKDLFHETVKNAPIKEAWIITDDPLRLKFGEVNFQIDLGAEKIIGAEKAGQKIAVEIKSFLNPSAITDFYVALGQFLSYRIALVKLDPDRLLYLAVPLDTYETFFQLEFTQNALQTYQICLIVYNSLTEEISQWINFPNIGNISNNY
ncbi:MAG: element excision factor XisH family protein [Snowella sp.]|nr:element excision factor XisH family protein [Snowella sp.]